MTARPSMSTRTSAVTTSCLLAAPRCHQDAGPGSGPILVARPSGQDGRARAVGGGADRVDAAQ
jgi:hypothetical protein